MILSPWLSNYIKGWCHSLWRSPWKPASSLVGIWGWRFTGPSGLPLSSPWHLSNNPSRGPQSLKVQGQGPFRWGVRPCPAGLEHTWSKRIMWGMMWVFLIGWLKKTRVTHGEIQMMTTFASKQLHEDINAKSNSNAACLIQGQIKVQLLFFLSRLFEEAEGCAGWVSRWRSSFQIQSWAGMS